MSDNTYQNNSIKKESASVRTTLSSSWTPKTLTPRSLSPVPTSKEESIYYKYIDLIHSKSNISTKDTAESEPPERPFDFFDDEEYAFGINLLNNNVACVGDNMSKLVQMAQEPWPDNVKLFQPYEVEQILLPDNASCLAVQAFLKMCNLPFEVEMRWNAEFMSPSGRVPFIKCGAFVVSELEPIVQFAANKGITLCSKLSTEEKAEMRAYMSLITNVLVNAELYISWVDNDTFNAVTKVRNSSVYPWPLGWLQTRAKRNMVIKRLKALHWYDKTLEQVLSDVEQCCNSLSQRLGERDYFFGNTPTALDARVYGHVRALLSAEGPKAALMIKPITSALLRHLIRMINVTQMQMTSQEEYLVYQAFRLPRVSMRPGSPVERNTKARSRMSTKIANSNSVNSKEVFAFKPFASKQIVMLTSKEGKITCLPTKSYQEGYSFVLEVCEDILDKVDERITNDYLEKIDSDIEKSDFEVIAYPKENTISKLSDYLDTIAENDVSDSLSADEDLIQIIPDDDVMDSDGVINDKHLGSDSVSHSKERGSVGSHTTISSKILSKDSPLNLTMSGGRTTTDEHESDKSASPATPDSSALQNWMPWSSAMYSPSSRPASHAES